MLKFLGNIIGVNKEGKIGESGVLSTIMEKSVGKISFRRSASIVVLTTVVAPDVISNGLTWQSAIVIVACLLATSVDKWFTKG